MIQSDGNITVCTQFFFPSLLSWREKYSWKRIEKTPCARAEEIRVKGKFRWVRVRLIGGAAVSVGETFAGLDRALLYSEASWRALPVARWIDRSRSGGEEEEEVSVVCARFGTWLVTSRDASVIRSSPSQFPGREMRCLAGYHRASR